VGGAPPPLFSGENVTNRTPSRHGDAIFSWRSMTVEWQLSLASNGATIPT
jgi:hypothetical protein